MQDLSKKQIFQALECCIIGNDNIAKCPECPLQHLDISECKQELVIQTAQYIEKANEHIQTLKITNTRYIEQLEHAEATISQLAVYERIVNEQCELIVNEMVKRISKIFCNKEGEQNE